MVLPSTGFLGIKMVLMSEGGCEELEVWGAEKGGPLSITILYGTPHSSRRDMTWNIKLEKHNDMMLCDSNVHNCLQG